MNARYATDSEFSAAIEATRRAGECGCDVCTNKREWFIAGSEWATSKQNGSKS